MSRGTASIRDLLVIIAVGCVVLLTNLGSTLLWDFDEALWGSTTMEMARRGDWIVPWHNGEISTHKPPFTFWVMLAGTGLCGENEVGYRIGSVVVGILTAVIVYRLGGLLFCRQVGLVAAIATLTAVYFVLVARAANPDVLLACLAITAVFIAVRYGLAGRGAAWPPRGRITTLPRAAAVAIYAVLGLAVLTKGPLGVALPASALALFVWWHNLLVSRESRAGRALGGRVLAFLQEAWSAAWTLRPLTGAAVVLLVAGPWYALVHERSGGAFGADFLGIHHWQRFLQPMEGHRGPWFYYLPALLVGMFPWSMFAIPTALDTAGRLRGRLEGRASALLLVSWLATWLGIFSLAQTKLPNYILPAYPAAAILVAAFLVRWVREPTASSRRWMQVALWLFVAIGAAISGGCLVAPAVRIGGVPLLEKVTAAESAVDILRLAAWSGGIIAAGGVAGLVLAARGRRPATVAAHAATAVALAVFLFGFVGAAAGRLQPVRELVRIIRSHETATDTPLGQCRYTQPSLVLYARRRVEQLETLAGCADFFSRCPDGLIVVQVPFKDDAATALPADAEILGEVAGFPKRSRLFVVRRAATGR